MALIICPECKNKISDRSRTCPHCGQSREDRAEQIAEHNRNLGAGCLVLLVAFVIAGLVGAWDKDDSASTVGDTSAKATTDKSKRKASTPKQPDADESEFSAMRQGQEIVFKFAALPNCESVGFSVEANGASYVRTEGNLPSGKQTVRLRMSDFVSNDGKRLEKSSTGGARVTVTCDGLTGESQRWTSRFGK